MANEMAMHGGRPDVPAAKPFSKSHQGLNPENGDSNCDFGETPSAVQHVQQEPRCRTRAGGVPQNKAAKAISSFKPLRPEDVWHPRIGAPLGNQNALKHGRYTKARKAQKKRLALLNAGVREIVRRAHRAQFRVDEILKRRAPSNPP